MTLTAELAVTEFPHVGCAVTLSVNEPLSGAVNVAVLPSPALAEIEPPFP